MANWNDPQPTTRDTRTGFGGNPTLSGGVIGREDAIDQGLRRYMLSIYNYMASGVLLSGIVALAMFTTGMAASMVGSPVMWLVVLSPLAIVLAMSFGQNRFSLPTLQAMF